MTVVVLAVIIVHEVFFVFILGIVRVLALASVLIFALV